MRNDLKLELLNRGLEFGGQSKSSYDPLKMGWEGRGLNMTLKRAEIRKRKQINQNSINSGDYYGTALQEIEFQQELIAHIEILQDRLDVLTLLP